VDNYRNVITNISREKFREVGKNRKFTISFRGEEIHRVCDSYSDVPVGEILALFGCNGHLEIAMNNGKAGNLLGLNPNDPVRVEFHD
jgi:S-adenosylmethionine hydrolase